jgi:hypothetical protein
MKCIALLFAPLLAAALGCNTAQISQPAPIDAGLPCPETPPAVSCDAGATQTAGACAGGVTLAIDSAEVPDASNTIPPGYFTLGCTVQFFVPDTTAGEISGASCLRAEPCTCAAADAGASDAEAGDAGSVQITPGVWQCFAVQQ